MEGLFEKIRATCRPAVWSRGVETVRRGAVRIERRDEDEIVFRIDARRGMVCPKVSLYLDDDTWDCDCDGPQDPCEHVAAAAIHLERGEPEPPIPAIAPRSLCYRLERRGRRLWFERGVEVDGEFEAIEATLDAVASGRVEGPRFLATRHDLTVEVALGTRKRGLLDAPVVERLFPALQHCPDIRLDGRKIRVSPRPVSPVVVAEDQGEGFRLRLADDPSVTERFEGGMALCGDLLRPAGVARLTGRELEELGRGRSYPVGAIPQLVTEDLPALRKRVPVDVRTDRLPEPVRQRPRIVIETRRDDDRLTATARLVYGEPVAAQIESGRLVAMGDGPLPLRDLDAERRLTLRLGRALGLAPGIPEILVGEAAVRFTAKLARWDGEVDGTGHESFRLGPPLVPRLEIRDDRFEIRFPVEGTPAAERGYGGASGGPAPEAVLRAWRNGESLIAVPEGGWSPLPADWLGRYGTKVADLLAARTVDGSVSPAALPDLARLCELLDRPVPASFERLRVLVEDFERIPETDLPADLRAELRDYQRKGVHWLAFLRRAGLGGVLADDMGLGKTLQALCAVRGRTLVVAPTSVLTNWREEAERFRPSLRLCTYHGPGRELDDRADLTVTSYAILRLDRERLTAIDWDTVVLDEAQAIKNPESQVAQAAHALAGGFRLALTGTPVENRLDELWSLFRFTNPGLLGGLGDFQERYARPAAEGDAEAAARLRARIRPFLLRRLKREVAPELPPRTDVVLHCELEPGERDVYDTVRAATRAEVVARLGSGGNVLAALEALLRLRQAACHPGLVPGQEAETSSKTDLLLDVLDTVVSEGHKALVFSQWTSLLDLVEPHLRHRGFEFLRLDGSTRDRAGVVRGFQDEAGPPVLLLSLKAGGTGLNLTAADHVFLLDPWWNPAVEDQAADRTHRIGQDRPVLVYRIVAAETVEERILDLQRRKREVAEAATGTGAAALAITRDELLALLD